MGSMAGLILPCGSATGTKACIFLVAIESTGKERQLRICTALHGRGVYTGTKSSQEIKTNENVENTERCTVLFSVTCLENGINILCICLTIPDILIYKHKKLYKPETFIVRNE